MTTKKRPNRPSDPNQLAKFIVDQSTRLPAEADLDSAWMDWVRGIGRHDDATMDLLRKAFDAGAQAGANGSSSAFARKGGRKGGPARAAKLSKSRRSEIAAKAARSRWTKRTGPEENH